MGSLANPLSIALAVGSQFVQNYQIKNPDGSLANIGSSTFEFVVRTDPSQPSTVTPVFSVTTVASPSGSISINTVTSTVTVTVFPVATALLSQAVGTYYYTLWENQGTTSAMAVFSGTAFAQFVAQP